MCGIAGIIYRDKSRVVERALLDKMVEGIRHRGPDGHGLFLSEGVGLAHTRLAIIDLTGGAQPLTLGSGTQQLSIVFNGEIYNHPELRRLLEHRGHHFQTHSDTETIVRAYQEFGAECVQYLNGMFAFAIWDAAQRRLFLARDRFGIKPLHYAETADGVLFCSDIRPLLDFPGVGRQLDLVALQQYFTFDYVPSPRTMFSQVKKFPAGHYAWVSEGRVDIQQYWDVSFAASESRAPVRWSEYESTLKEKLVSAVQMELLSDVPVGVFISGGLDSGAVAAAIRQRSNAELHSFSARFEDPSFDESPYARLIAKQLGTTHHELSITSAMIVETAQGIGKLLDEPLADSSFIPTHLLSKFTREKVKVVLSGDGGDELFAGYPTYRAHQLIAYYERILPRALRAQLVPWIVNALPVSLNNLSADFKLKRFIGGRGLPLEVRHFTWAGGSSIEQRQSLFAPWMSLPEIDHYEPARNCMKRTDAREALNRILYCDMKLFLENDILAKVDRAAMGHALEVRVPLLNRRFAEYAIDLPFNHKLRFGSPKYIFKKACRDLLPKEVLRRPKKGFNVPIAKLLNAELKDLADDCFSSLRANTDYFNADYIQTLVGEHRSLRQDHRKILWPLMVFELWRRENA